MADHQGKGKKTQSTKKDDNDLNTENRRKFGFVYQVIGVVFIATILPVLVQALYWSEFGTSIDSRVSCKRFPSLCAMNRNPSPLKSLVQDSFESTWKEGHKFGRWITPPLSVEMMTDMHKPGMFWRFFLQKRWSYTSVTTDRYFLAFAFVHLGYVGDIFLYIVDRENVKEMFEYHQRSPLGFGLRFAPHSMRECSSFGSLSLCFDEEKSLWMAKAENIHVTNTKTGAITHLSFDVSYPREEALFLSYPLDGNLYRPAMVHKAAGIEAKGHISFLNHHPNGQVGKSYQFLNGSATVDWTKALARRTTIWRWASLSSNSVTVVTKNLNTSAIVKAKRRVGINLSNFVYDVQDHRFMPSLPSSENGIWIDGHIIPLVAPVIFNVPPKKGSSQKEMDWNISIPSSMYETGEELNIVVTPLGAREDHANFFIVVSDFVQPYGHFKGSIRVRDPVRFEEHFIHLSDGGNYIGVVEDHYAVW